MKKDTRLVSVCIPCYNHEKYILDCLDSIIDQTYQNIEVVIIDDNSTDSSFSIIESQLERMKKRFVRVIVKRNKINYGVVKNCNRLMRMASGDYIKLIASDDVLRKDAIEYMVCYMDENRDVNVCVGNSVRVPENYCYGDVVDLSDKLINVEWINKRRRLFVDLLKGNFIVCTGQFFRRDILKRYGAYDENMKFEDWDFFLRVQKKENIVFLDDVVAYYRLAEHSISSFKRCSGIEQVKKFYYMYKGEEQTILKHITSVSKVRGKIILEDFYNRELEEAQAIGNKSLLEKIEKDYKKKVRKKTSVFVRKLYVIEGLLFDEKGNNFFKTLKIMYSSLLRKCKIKKV